MAKIDAEVSNNAYLVSALERLFMHRIKETAIDITHTMDAVNGIFYFSRQCDGTCRTIRVEEH